jgi:hypothetical protein
VKTVFLVSIIAAQAAQQPVFQPAPPFLSSQTAFAEAFVQADWATVKNGLAEDAKLSVYNPKSHQDQTVTGRDQAIALLSSIRPSLGEIAVITCTVDVDVKVNPPVICQYSWADKNISLLVTIAHVRGDRVTDFGLGFAKKEPKQSHQPERGD